MWRVDSLEKTLMLGVIGGRRRRDWQRMRWLDGITDPMDVSLGELRELVMDREAWRAAIHGVTNFRHDWATELNWTHLHPSTDNWIKDSLSMAPPNRARPSFPLSQSLPPGTFHKLLIKEAYQPSPSKGRQTENSNHKKLTNLITWATALSNSMKLWAMPCRATKDGWMGHGESSDKMWSLGALRTP